MMEYPCKSTTMPIYIGGVPYKDGIPTLQEEIYKNICASEPDMVNHPPHYGGKVETIDYLEDKLTHEEFVGYLKGNVLKYMSRLGKKDKPVQDAKKAKWYLDRLISTYEAEGKNIAS